MMDADGIRAEGCGGPAGHTHTCGKLTAQTDEVHVVAEEVPARFEERPAHQTVYFTIQHFYSSIGGSAGN